MTYQHTRRGNTQTNNEAVICPPLWGITAVRRGKGVSNKGHCRLFTSPLEGEDARRADEGEMEEKGTGFAHNPGLTPHPGANAHGPLPQWAGGTTRGFTIRPSSSRPCGRQTVRDIGAAPALYPALQASGMTKRRARGFTLIELLVVVLIIGILATVALPQYQKAVKKARGTEVITAIDAYDKAISAYYLTHGFYGGAGPDTLDVQMPVLKHFLYAAGQGMGRTPEFQSGSNLSQVGTGTFAQILFVEKGTTLGVWAAWEKGSRPQRWCADNGKDISKECAAYFGSCTWNSRDLRCYF